MISKVLAVPSTITVSTANNARRVFFIATLATTDPVSAYDSDPLDEELRRNGIEMIAPHRSNRTKPPTQDRRRLNRYMRRWLVERFFAWIQWQRRILVRWEYHAQNFLGFVQLACLVILFRRF
jgi:transposase